MRALKLAAVAAVSILMGCASATTQSAPPPSPSPAERASRNVLTREQLAATNSDNLYDALSKLRPEWLSSRGPTSVSDPTPTAASVYMSGTMLGKADALKDMRILDVSEVRYWDAGQASARFGMGHPRGVIEITRK